MKKVAYSLSVMAFVMLLLNVNAPAQNVDQSGRWGLGVHGGLYKLVLTDHSDIWTVGMLANADLKYGVSRKVSLGIEGNWMQTYLANRSGTENAGMTFDKVKNGPRQRAYIAGLLGEYHFMPDKSWSPFLSFGTGMYIWRWTDKNGHTLISADPSLVGTETPPRDLDTNCYYMRDQELYAMGGLGLEVFPSKSLSFELGAKFRYLTHLFTNFKDDRKIV